MRNTEPRMSFQNAYSALTFGQLEPFMGHLDPMNHEVFVFKKTFHMKQCLLILITNMHYHILNPDAK